MLWNWIFLNYGFTDLQNFKSIISILDIGAYCSCVLMVPGACAVSNSCNMSKNTKLLATECCEGWNYQVKLAVFFSNSSPHFSIIQFLCSLGGDTPKTRKGLPRITSLKLKIAWYFYRWIWKWRTLRLKIVLLSAERSFDHSRSFFTLQQENITT